MNRAILAATAVLIMSGVQAQTENPTSAKKDTVKVGGMIIIRDQDTVRDNIMHSDTIRMGGTTIIQNRQYRFEAKGNMPDPDDMDRKIRQRLKQNGFSFPSDGSAPDTIRYHVGDTIRVGNMIIIRKKDSGRHIEINLPKDQPVAQKPRKAAPRHQTSWIGADIGFNNFTDRTLYSIAASDPFLRRLTPGEPTFGSGDFNLRNGKSMLVNIWLFRSQYSFFRSRWFNLIYGLILERNQYRFDTDVRTSYKTGNDPYIFRDNIGFTKNQLHTDYLTLPVMLGFRTSPGLGAFTFSVGASIGYLYSSRNKQISSERGKQIIKGNFDLEPFKFQYIGEIGMAGIKLFGGYSPRSMYRRALDHRPYQLGLRLMSTK